MQNTNTIKKLIFFLIIIQLFLSCQTQQIEKQMIINSNTQTEGFLNDDIFQLKSYGQYRYPASSLVQRRKESIENAIKRSHQRFLDLIIEYKLTELQKKYPTKILEINPASIPDLSKKLQVYQSYGLINYREFFNDGRSLVTYRIKYPGLKKEIDRFELDLLDSQASGKLDYNDQINRGIIQIKAVAFVSNFSEKNLSKIHQKDSPEPKKLCLERARKNAEEKLKRIFQEYLGKEKASSKINLTEDKVDMIKETEVNIGIQKILQQGKVFQTTMQDQGQCSIIFQIRDKNLQNALLQLIGKSER